MHRASRGHLLPMVVGSSSKRTRVEVVNRTERTNQGGNSSPAMNIYVLCVLFVACAATARAFDVDPYWKECSVNRTRPGSRTALHSAGEGQQVQSPSLPPHIPGKIRGGIQHNIDGLGFNGNHGALLVCHGSGRSCLALQPN